MRQTMVLCDKNGYKTQHICFQCGFYIDPKSGAEPCDHGITIYYSQEEAEKAGWVLTDSIWYCPPNKPAVWICPLCYEG